ncbi:hypothetical protein lerEdw1_011341 [Lerista edwardsae]|nr:hypothetical protein lerEdw1_011341 [Lerista edwardsae]
MSEITVGEEVITKVGDVAKLSCTYKMPTSLTSLQAYKPNKIYWQKEEKNKPAVVAVAYVNNQEELSSKDSLYLNRTKMDEQNFTLSIFPVKVSDRGIYKCIILLNFDVQKTCTVNLSVMADFSEPIINPPNSRHCLPQLKLTCFSHGGYPKPKMDVFVNNELVELNYHFELDNQTQLINITGKVLINATEEILLVNCSVIYPGFHRSTSLYIRRDCTLEQPPSHGVIIAIIVIIVFVTLFIVLVIIFRCHSKYQGF